MADFILLPRETTQLIVAYLPDNDIKLLRLANTWWFNFIKYSRFTFYLARDADVSRIANRFSKYSWPVGFTFRKPLITDYKAILNRLASIPSLTSLSIYKFKDWHLAPLTNLTTLPEYELDIDQLGVLPSIKRMTIHGSGLPAKLENGLKIYSQLESLTLKTYTYEKEVNICGSISNPSLLTRLNVDIYGKINLEHLSKFTNLKSFRVGNGIGAKIPLKLPTLEELTTQKIDLLEGVWLCTNLTNLHLDRDETRKGPFKSYADNMTAFTKLKVLSMNEQEDNELDLTMTFLKKLKNLEKFKFIPKYGSDFIYSKVFSYITSDHLTSLEVLINHNDMTGENATRSCLEDIGTLISLKEFSARIELKSAIDLTALGGLKHLTKLDLVLRGPSYNFKGFINKLTALKILRISAPKFTADLSPLVNLVELNGAGSEVDSETMKSIASLTRLTKLCVTCKKDFDADLLSKLPLRSLNIYPREDLTSWPGLAKLTDLRELYLSSFKSDTEVERLTALRHLTYLNCTAGKAKEMTFSRLTTLQKIYLQQACMTQEQVDKFKAKMPYLWDYRLSGGGFDLYLSPDD